MKNRRFLQALIFILIVAIKPVCANEQEVAVISGNLDFGDFKQNQRSLSALLHQTVTAVALQNNLKVSTLLFQNDQCDTSFCGYQSLNDLINNESLPSVALVINVNAGLSTGIQAVDLVSQQVLSSITIELGESVLAEPNLSKSAQSAYAKALEQAISDASLLVIQQLKENKKSYQISFNVEALTQTELQYIETKLRSFSAQIGGEFTLLKNQVAQSWLFSGGLNEGWFLQYDSEFRLISTATPTQVWQSFTQVINDANLSITIEGNTITVARKGPAFLLQKLLLTLLIVILIYALLNYIWWQFVSAKLQILDAQKHATRWLKLYQLWLYSPFYIPLDIKRQALDLKQQLNLSQQYSLEIKQALSKQQVEQAKYLLSQLSATDRSFAELSELKKEIEQQEKQVLSQSNQTLQVKECLSSAVNALTQGQNYQAYYFCYLAKKHCQTEQYQEIAAIDKLLQKIASRAKQNLQEASAETVANLIVKKSLESPDSGAEMTAVGRHYLLSNHKQIQIGRDNNTLRTDQECLYVPVNHSAVSSFHKHLKIENAKGLFTALDLGSKNGTWLNQTLLDGHPRVLETEEIISLSAKQGTTPLQFCISTDSINQSLKIELDKTNAVLFDRSHLINVWNNFIDITSSDFWLVGAGIYLCFDNKQGLYFSHLHELSKSPLVLAKIFHKDTWKIRPEQDDPLSNRLVINDATLIGEVVLESSTKIDYQQHSIQLSYASDKGLIENQYA